MEAVLDAALPCGLAGAVETHMHLSARRVRVAWQDGQAAATGTDERARGNGALRVNLGVLAFLLAFSYGNQLNYRERARKPLLSSGG